jgi:hypothetical protein
MLLAMSACASGASFHPRAAIPNVRAISAMNGFSAIKLPGPELDQQLTAMRANGVELVRGDAPWANVEPNLPGPSGPQWQWSGMDWWASELASHGVRWEPILDFSVGWAKTCPGFCPPTSNATYATYARAVAARYGAHGTFWSQHPWLPYLPAQIFEIWNEENSNHFWSTGPDPRRYARLFLAARTAIRLVDPSASVMIGGIGNGYVSYDPHNDLAGQFVKRMFAAVPGLKGHIDGFGLHLYVPTPADVVDFVVHYRQVLDSLGESHVPIDITEFGWPVGGVRSEAIRGEYMRDVALQLADSNCGIRMLAPYDWINPLIYHEPADFGFVDRTGLFTALRPAGVGWFQGLAEARNQPMVRGWGALPRRKR